MTLFVGTSGWAYPQWKPDFYPPGVPRARWLSHYASRLSACELNATFYKVQERSVIEGWAGKVPEGFRFAVKAHRALTYGRSIAPDDRRAHLLDEFLEQTAALGSRRGPILFQVPAHRKIDTAALRELLQALPPDADHAFEFRDDSWKENDVVELIEASGGTICLSNVDAEPPDSLPGGAIGYVRLRAERYPPRQRAGWRNLLQSEAEARDVYVFTKHEEGPATDPFGGVGMAAWLQRYARTRSEAAGQEP